MSKYRFYERCPLYCNNPHPHTPTNKCGTSMLSGIPVAYPWKMFLLESLNLLKIKLLDWSDGLILWIDFMDWSYGLILWIDLMDWSYGLILLIGSMDWFYELTRKYPLRGCILGVLTHTTAWDRLWGGDAFPNAPRRPGSPPKASRSGRGSDF